MNEVTMKGVMLSLLQEVVGVREIELPWSRWSSPITSPSRDRCPDSQEGLRVVETVRRWTDEWNIKPQDYSDVTSNGRMDE